MKTLYLIVQWSWGLLQTLFGLFLFVLHLGDKHYPYHGAIVTEWTNKSSISLGMFVFITSEPYFAEKFKGKITVSELSSRLLVHEYGHTIQSLLLGPLYLIIIGLPSTLWGFLPCCNRLRRLKQISYFSFYTEKWANYLGEKIAKEKSMEELIID